MKASVYQTFGSPEVLQLTEIPDLRPQKNELLIRIRATTVSAVDNIYRKGNPWIARIDAGFFKPKHTVLGTDFAGEVVAIGEEVVTFNVGDRVFGSTAPLSGTHAEYVCLSETASVIAMPHDSSFEEAAAIPYGGLTALPFLRDSAKIRPGQKVLIIGASGAVGSFATQLSAYYGAETVGVCSTPNIPLVKSLGATRVIDYTREDYTAEHNSYDVVFDAGGKSSFQACKATLKKGGVYLTTVIGFPILFQMAWTSLFGGKKAIFTATGLRKLEKVAKDLIFLRTLIESGELVAVIDRCYPFEEMVEAHRHVDTGRKRGNVVVSLF